MTSLATTHGSGDRRRRKGGRPHKGKRHLFQTRVPQSLADIVTDQAAANGLNLSDYLASVIAKAHDYPDPIQHRSGSDGSIQEEMHMQTAS